MRQYPPIRRWMLQPQSLVVHHLRQRPHLTRERRSQLAHVMNRRQPQIQHPPISNPTRQPSRNHFLRPLRQPPIPHQPRHRQRIRRMPHQRQTPPITIGLRPRRPRRIRQTHETPRIDIHTREPPRTTGSLQRPTDKHAHNQPSRYTTKTPARQHLSQTNRYADSAPITTPTTPVPIPGPSPRGRGAVGGQLPAEDSPGLIPGACGEHTSIEAKFVPVLGSSPRMRGAPQSGPRAHPLSAGSMVGRPVAPPVTAEHPRACGEHWGPCSPRVVSGGSSPRMRGTRPDIGRASSRPRLIPARAGSTLSATLVIAAGAAHPRACGEHRSALSRICQVAGSSPRVRGHASPAVALGPCLGSSPRVRGALRICCGAVPFGGLIPARAGSTSLSPHTGDSGTAHPRACGEHTY